MKNTTIVAIALIVLFLGGVGVYSFTNKDSAMQKPEVMVKEEAMMKNDTAPDTELETVMMKKEDTAEALPENAMMEKSGKYVSSTPELLANSANIPRVLFFYANWCPTCKSADENFNQNTSKIPADVTLIRVNYNDTDTDQSEKELAKKYGITYQHTFVQIDAQGNEIAKWNGGEIEELQERLK